jgi:hypothetical protein
MRKGSVKRNKNKKDRVVFLTQFRSERVKKEEVERLLRRKRKRAKKMKSKKKNVEDDARAPCVLAMSGTVYNTRNEQLEARLEERKREGA